MLCAFWSYIRFSSWSVPWSPELEIMSVVLRPSHSRDGLDLEPFLWYLGVCIMCIIFPYDHMSSSLLVCKFPSNMDSVSFIVLSSTGSSLTDRRFSKCFLHGWVNYTVSWERTFSCSFAKAEKAVWSKELVWTNRWQVESPGHSALCSLSGAAPPWPNSTELPPPWSITISTTPWWFCKVRYRPNILLLSLIENQ